MDANQLPETQWDPTWGLQPHQESPPKMTSLASADNSDQRLQQTEYQHSEDVVEETQYVPVEPDTQASADNEQSQLHEAVSPKNNASTTSAQPPNNPPVFFQRTNIESLNKSPGWKLAPGNIKKGNLLNNARTQTKSGPDRSPHIQQNLNTSRSNDELGGGLFDSMEISRPSLADLAFETPIIAGVEKQQVPQFKLCQELPITSNNNLDNASVEQDIICDRGFLPLQASISSDNPSPEDLKQCLHLVDPLHLSSNENTSHNTHTNKSLPSGILVDVEVVQNKDTNISGPKFETPNDSKERRKIHLKKSLASKSNASVPRHATSGSFKTSQFLFGGKKKGYVPFPIDDFTEQQVRRMRHGTKRSSDVSHPASDCTANASLQSADSCRRPDAQLQGIDDCLHDVSLESHDTTTLENLQRKQPMLNRPKFRGVNNGIESNNTGLAKNGDSVSVAFQAYQKRPEESGTDRDMIQVDQPDFREGHQADRPGTACTVLEGPRDPRQNTGKDAAPQGQTFEMQISNAKKRKLSEEESDLERAEKIRIYQNEQDHLLRSLRKDAKDNQDKVIQQRGEIEKLKAFIGRSKEEANSLQTRNIAVAQQVANLVSEKQQLTEKLSELTDANGRYKEKSNVISELKTEIIALREGKESMIATIKELYQQVTLAGELKAVRARVERINEETRSLILDAAGARNKYRELQGQLNSKTKDVENLERLREECLHELSTEKQKVSNLEEKLAKAQANRSEITEALSKLPTSIVNVLSDSDGILAKKLATEGTTHTKLDEMITNMTILNNGILEPSPAFKKLLDDLFTRIELALPSKQAEDTDQSPSQLLEQLKQHITQAQIDYQRHDELGKQISDLREKHATIAGTVSTRDMEIRGLNKQMEEFKRDLVETRSALTRKSEEVATLQALPKEDPQIHNKLRISESRNASLQIQLNSANQEMAKVSAELMSAKENSLAKDEPLRILRGKVNILELRAKSFDEEKNQYQRACKVDKERAIADVATLAQETGKSITQKAEAKIKNLEQKRAEANSLALSLKNEKEKIHEGAIEIAKQRDGLQVELERKKEYILQQELLLKQLEGRIPDLDSLVHHHRSLQAVFNNQKELQRQLHAEIDGCNEAGHANRTWQVRLDEHQSQINKIHSLSRRQESNASDGYSRYGEIVGSGRGMAPPPQTQRSAPERSSSTPPQPPSQLAITESTSSTQNASQPSPPRKSQSVPRAPSKMAQLGYNVSKITSLTESQDADMSYSCTALATSSPLTDLGEMFPMDVMPSISQKVDAEVCRNQKAAVAFAPGPAHAAPNRVSKVSTSEALKSALKKSTCNFPHNAENNIHAQQNRLQITRQKPHSSKSQNTGMGLQNNSVSGNRNSFLEQPNISPPMRQPGRNASSLRTPAVTNTGPQKKPGWLQTGLERSAGAAAGSQKKPTRQPVGKKRPAADVPNSQNIKRPRIGELDR